MEITLETVVFYFLAAFITVFSILTGNDPPHGALGPPTCCSYFSVRQASTFCWVTPSSVPCRLWSMPAVSWYSTSSPYCLPVAKAMSSRSLKRSRFLAGLGATVGGAIIVVFITLKHKFIATTDVEPLEVNIKTIGHHMLSGDKYGYLLPFEAVSILLLACIVGGLLIARKR